MPKAKTITTEEPAVPAMDEDTTQVTALPDYTNLVNDGEQPAPSVPAMDGATTTVTALPDYSTIPNSEVAQVEEDQTRQRSGRNAIVIRGEGTMPIYDKGIMRRVNRGETIHATNGEVAYLTSNGVAFDEE